MTIPPPVIGIQEEAQDFPGLAETLSSADFLVAG